MTRWSRSKVMAICSRAGNDADERINPALLWRKINEAVLLTLDAIWLHEKKCIFFPRFLFCVFSIVSLQTVTVSIYIQQK
jgi:hypothetical protein